MARSPNVWSVGRPGVHLAKRHESALGRLAHRVTAPVSRAAATPESRSAKRRRPFEQPGQARLVGIARLAGMDDIATWQLSRSLDQLAVRPRAEVLDMRLLLRSS